jgi:Ca-activated chloride channel family protein
MSSSWPKFLGLVWAVVALSAPARGFSVYIDRPTFLDPALGEVEVVARVEAREPVRSVALVVDGRPQAILGASPFRWIVEVGEDNLEHTFKVIARSVSGEVAEAVVVTPRLQIDDRVDLELQQLYVTVTKSGRSVEDLARTRFTITDQGEPQEIVTFERGDVPLTAVVLLDVSASMSGFELDLALSSSRAFVEGLETLDQAMLLLFSDRIIRSTDFTGFREVLSTALSDVTATGATALNDHLYVGLKQLERRQGRRVVLLLSDGVDSASALSMADVLRYAESSPALVYWLRLPRPGADISSAWLDVEGYREELSGLEELVKSSGGRVLDLADVSEAASAFGAVLEELRGQYVLGYYPSNRTDDGAWHTVKVKVTGSGFKVRTRQGYIDF